MRVYLYAMAAGEGALASAELIAYARSRQRMALLEGAWLDEGEDGSLLQRHGGNDLLGCVQRGDHLVVPSVGSLAGPLRDLTEAIDHLVYARGLTLHFVTEGFVNGLGGDANRMRELAEEAYREWRVRRTREGLADLKAKGRPVAGWSPYGERIGFRNAKRTTVGCWWERRWVARIVAWREAGMTYPAIVAELNRRKARTSRNTAWNVDQVRRVVEAQGPGRAGSVCTWPPSDTLVGNDSQRSGRHRPREESAYEKNSDEPETFEVGGL